MPVFRQRTKFEQLLTDQVYQNAWRYASRLSATREDAEDLLQDALAIAVRKVGGLRETSRFSGWLLSIIRRRFIDRCRRASARPLTAELPEQLAAVDAESASDPLGVLVSTGMAKLPPEQNELLGLFYLDGLNLQETGEVLGIPVAAVRQRLYRARQALRRSIEQTGAPWVQAAVTAGSTGCGGEDYGT